MTNTTNTKTTEELLYENTILLSETILLLNKNTVLHEENTVLHEKNTVLHEKNTVLHEENTVLHEKNTELQSKIATLEEYFRLHKNKEYGKSSEKTSNVLEEMQSGDCFNEAETECKPDAPEPEIEQITYTRRKKRVGYRDAQLKDLPEEIIEYSLPEEKQVCSCCNGKLHKASEKIRRELKIIPAQISVVNHVQHIYSCRNCESNGIYTKMILAPMPNPAFSGSLASPSAVAFVMNQKYTEGLPLYRQEQAFRRLDIELSRQVLANWIIKASSIWLIRIYNLMKKHLVKKDILYSDDTKLQVIHESGRAATTKSYMWLYRSGRDGPPIIIYEYQTTRAGKHPTNFLKEFKGYLHVDGYECYNSLNNVKLVGCWAHARRKFADALKALPKEQKFANIASQEGLSFCNKLFEIDCNSKNVTNEERYEKRLELSKPILDKFLIWLKYHKSRALPKGPLGIAVNYCLNQWDKLNMFLNDGRLEIDNNRSERSIKPFVIGRKNWLFSNTSKGAEASSIAYSIIETAKENNINPFEYLKYLFEKLPNIDIDNEDMLTDLLPYSESLPEWCKIKLN